MKPSEISNFFSRNNIGNKKWISIGIGIVCILGIFLFFKSRSSGEFDEIQTGSIIDSVFGLATINSSNIYHLRVAVPSVILKVFIDKGDTVKKDSNLIQFDSFGILRSPISGIVTNLNYETGELVTPQSPILTIMDLTKTYLSVSLEERAAVKVKKGQLVRIRFEALGDKIFSGKVASVYPSDGQFEVKIDVENFPEQLLPGMTADVSIEISRRDNVVLVPTKSIKKNKIKILRDNKLIEISIEVGISNQDFTEVISAGINSGDKVLRLEGN